MRVIVYDRMRNVRRDQSRREFFKASDLENTVWAFATVGVKHEKLMKAVEDRAVDISEDLSDEALTNIVWAFTQVGMPHEALLKVARERSSNASAASTRAGGVGE